MSTTPRFCGSLAGVLAAVLAAGCSSSGEGTGGNAPDPFNGLLETIYSAPAPTSTVPYPSVLGANYAPTTVSAKGPNACTTSTSGSATSTISCYPMQGVYAGGTYISVWNTSTSTQIGAKPISPTLANHQAADGSGGWHVDDFPHACQPAAFDPVNDAFKRTEQFPIADALPLNNSTVSRALPVLGLVAVHGVTGIQGATCNDLKSHESIASPSDGEPGKFGAVRTADPIGYEVWMVFDPNKAINAKGYKTVTDPSTGQIVDFTTSWYLYDVNVKPVSVLPKWYWYEGQLVPYVSSGRIPVDADGNLVAMDGVILDSAYKTYEKPTTNGAVILPYKPGEAGYSPIVRLHDFLLPAGKKIGDYQGLCAAGTTNCPSNFINMGNLCDASAGSATVEGCVTQVPFNTIFIVGFPQ